MCLDTLYQAWISASFWPGLLTSLWELMKELSCSWGRFEQALRLAQRRDRSRTKPGGGSTNIGSSNEGPMLSRATIQTALVGANGRGAIGAPKLVRHSDDQQYRMSFGLKPAEPFNRRGLKHGNESQVARQCKGPREDARSVTSV